MTEPVAGQLTSIDIIKAVEAPKLDEKDNKYWYKNITGIAKLGLSYQGESDRYIRDALSKENHSSYSIYFLGKDRKDPNTVAIINKNRAAISVTDARGYRKEVIGTVWEMEIPLSDIKQEIAKIAPELLNNPDITPEMIGVRVFVSDDGSYPLPPTHFLEGPRKSDKITMSVSVGDPHLINLILNAKLEKRIAPRVESIKAAEGMGIMIGLDQADNQS